MIATFDFNGYTIKLGGTGIGGKSKNGGDCAGGVPDGHVAFQLFEHPLGDTDTPPDGYYVCGWAMTPSHARALASAMLSAATEARQ